MTFNWEEIDKIDGWLFKEEAKLLYDLAFALQDNEYYLEVGSWKGKSAVAAAQSGANVIAVDWFKGSPETAGADTLEEYLSNTKGYPRIETFVGKSEEVFIPKRNLQIGLLFIDGEHTYEACSRDFTKWSEYVPPGGFIVFHDAYGENGEEENTPWPDVTKFVKQLKNYGYKEITKVRRCSVFQKQ